ncbi:MAG: primosomal protein N', partial [Pseudomonadota bacterium]
LRGEAHDVTKLDQFLENAQRYAHDIVTKNAASGINVWEPVASTLERKAGATRKQLMVQADHRATLQQFLSQWLRKIRASDSRAVKWIIDVDPIEV